MKKSQPLIIFLLILFGCSAQSDNAHNLAKSEPQEDAYLWLEEISSEPSLAWVEEQNEKSKQTLEKSPDFKPMQERFLSILESKEKIPHVQKLGDYYYNFWTDDTHIRGLIRRTSPDEYKKDTPHWETVLDLDSLAEEENENWTWHGYEVLYPSYDRALIFLSRGGSDACVVREFDFATKSFVPNGFYLPEAKSNVSWKNRDTLYVGTDFGPGTLTHSGYPKIIKEWKHETPLTEASLIFSGDETDVSVSSWVATVHGRIYEVIYQMPTFFTNNVYLFKNNAWVKIDKPSDATIGIHQAQLLLTLRSDWTIGGETYQAGSLLAMDVDNYLVGERNFQILFTPTDESSLSETSSTKNYLVLNALDHVRNKISLLKLENGNWVHEDFEAPSFGSTYIYGIDPDASDEYFMTHTDYLTPTSLWIGKLGHSSREKLKSLPSYFHADDLEIMQYEAVSKDGTKIPYFQVNKKDLSLNRNNPTLLYGYGGFEISLQPRYQAMRGSGWLERGGVYVEANIRGGGEFGPKWHEAARKENRQRAYDDFIAVAEDLIARGVTSPAHLGIQGGSNGGLLMGVMLTQRPDLWNAVLCQVPLLDMKRYHKLLAGASWIDEYGNPEIDSEWAFIKKYSPYHNLQEKQNYPHVFFTTSTRDDRVHPGHARKMAAKMKDFGYNVLYYENTEGGHSGAANNKQIAYKSALEYMFLIQELK